MDEVFEAKALTRNSMMDKLRSKIQAKKIEVQTVSEDEWDLDREEGAPFSMERALVNASKPEPKAKPDILDSYLAENPLYAVAEVDGGILGGTLADVMGEISKASPNEVSFVIVTTDENAAKEVVAEDVSTGEAYVIYSPSTNGYLDKSFNSKKNPLKAQIYSDLEMLKKFHQTLLNRAADTNYHGFQNLEIHKIKCSTELVEKL